MDQKPENKIKRLVLAYSGGLDTSVAMAWIKETYGCEVVAFCADVGQGEDLEAARDKALRLGAESAHVANMQEEFVRDYVFPAIRAGAVYEGEYLLGTSLARPCIAKGMMDVYREVGADAISHGATGKGNDQVRFELAAYHFEPSVRVISPWREWSFKGRQQLIDYARDHGIPVEATTEKPYSVDRNLLHTSYEGGVLEDPWREPDPGMFQLTRDPTEAPDQPRRVEISLERGVPVAVDGEALGPVALMVRLNQIAGEHGVGRVDLVENRFVGMKSRGVYETPGGTILLAAHRGIESITLDRGAAHLKDELMPRYAELIYNGLWFTPEREMLQAAIDQSQANVTGTVRLKLFKGSVQVVGRKSPLTLYSHEYATFEADTVYDQRDAEGFIKLNALRLRIKGLSGKLAAEKQAEG